MLVVEAAVQVSKLVQIQHLLVLVVLVAVVLVQLQVDQLLLLNQV
jgi:hypothetical protein